MSSERLMPVGELINRMVDSQAPGLREQVQKDRDIEALLKQQIALLDELIELDRRG